MTTERDAVALPEKPAESESERDRLGRAVDWWESEYGAVTEAEMAEAAAERREIERAHARSTA
ncbi:hypothetical protein [Streptomyces zhihengii]|uniref:Uncharacterized protein n=1 Tax=Streptomyces zhihengii TaxID=1818004 RepID=A0ABS2UQ48_9ACTN|nr:hypothetical protein [Streptomyces zhihengii]MBM9618840.1 hypothetical protein [Streptomyces zhihengii]